MFVSGPFWKDFQIQGKKYNVKIKVHVWWVKTDDLIEAILNQL